MLLVLDVSGQSQTAAAIARGFATHDPGVRIAGAVLNQVASPRHERLARDAVEAVGVPVVGAVHRNPDMQLPERHLGLVQAREHAALEAFIERLADVMETSLDLDATLALAAPLAPEPGADAAALPPPGQRIAVAEDAAFSFLYPHVARALARRRRRARALLAARRRGAGPGLRRLLAAGRLPRAARRRARRGGALPRRRSPPSPSDRPVHGECGGFMVLGRALQDADGAMHPMAGLLDHVTSFARRGMNLGYRQARLLHDAPIGRAGETLRGHEFHYSRLLEPGRDAPLAELQDGLGRPLGPSGARRGRVSGTFFHAIARG